MKNSLRVKKKQREKMATISSTSSDKRAVQSHNCERCGRITRMPSLCEKCSDCLCAVPGCGRVQRTHNGDTMSECIYHSFYELSHICYRVGCNGITINDEFRSGDLTVEVNIHFCSQHRCGRCHNEALGRSGLCTEHADDTTKIRKT